jgi:hypothetical protein
MKIILSSKNFYLKKDFQRITTKPDNYKGTIYRAPVLFDKYLLTVSVHSAYALIIYWIFKLLIVMMYNTSTVNTVLEENYVY